MGHLNLHKLLLLLAPINVHNKKWFYVLLNIDNGNNININIGELR